MYIHNLINDYFLLKGANTLKMLYAILLHDSCFALWTLTQVDKHIVIIINYYWEIYAYSFKYAIIQHIQYFTNVSLDIQLFSNFVFKVSVKFWKRIIQLLCLYSNSMSCCMYSWQSLLVQFLVPFRLLPRLSSPFFNNII